MIFNISVVGWSIYKLDFTRCVIESVRWFVQPVQQRSREVDGGRQIVGPDGETSVGGSYQVA